MESHGKCDGTFWHQSWHLDNASEDQYLGFDLHVSEAYAARDSALIEPCAGRASRGTIIAAAALGRVGLAAAKDFACAESAQASTSLGKLCK